MPYQFTCDWFTPRSQPWLDHVVPRLPRPFAWLEIGSYEGRSACWLLDNVMQPGDALTCVDPWLQFADVYSTSAESRFDANTAGRVEKHKARSYDFLVQASAQRRVFHGVYVDGDHEARMALEDLVLCWRLVPVGGVIVIDDYEWPMPPSKSHLLPPKPAVDAFLHIYGSRLKVLWKDWQVIVEKTAE